MQHTLEREKELKRDRQRGEKDKEESEGSEESVGGLLVVEEIDEDDDFGHHVLDEYDEVVLDPTIGEKVRSREERSDELGIRYSWS